MVRIILAKLLRKKILKKIPKSSKKKRTYIYRISENIGTVKENKKTAVRRNGENKQPKIKKMTL